MNRQKGFTIVELLVTIVIISILAAITTVAYTNIQNRALNAARLQETVAWAKHLELYRATYGAYPSMPTDTYCLGRGFPDGDGIAGGECESYLYDNPDYRHHENDAVSLMNELEKVGTLPGGPKKPVGEMVGPYMSIWPGGYTIGQVFHGNADECPPPMSYSWHNGNDALLCYISSD